MKKDADEKGIRLNHLKRTSNTLLHEMNYLKVVLEGRVEYFDLFQKTVIVIAKQNFTQMMAIRNFTGMLSVDHGEKILELDVSKIDSAKALEPEAKKAKKIKDSGNMKSLSGGEKSYATICLLLSLWENIETPFRALDEVFFKVII